MFTIPIMMSSGASSSSVIEYVGSASATGGPVTWGTSCSPSITAEEGDVVFVVGTAGRTFGVNNIWISTSGYTEVSKVTGTANFDSYGILGWKVMGSTPDTSVTVNCNASAGSDPLMINARAFVFRSVDPATPIIQYTMTATNGDHRPNPASLTPSDGTLVFYGGGGCSNSDFLSSVGWTNEIIDNFNSTREVCNAFGWDNEVAGSVPIDPARMNGNAPNLSNTGWQFILEMQPA